MREIALATELYLGDRHITSLQGIEKLTALAYLDCGGYGLTSINLSKNTALIRLECADNKLTELDLSKNTALTYLDCSYNSLTELDLHNNTALIYLDCSDNQLKTLDVSKHTRLQDLRCNYNMLTVLDLSNNKRLSNLDCYGQDITISGVTADGIPTHPYSLNLNTLKSSLGVSTDITDFLSRVHSADVFVDYYTVSADGMVYFSSQPKFIDYYYDTRQPGTNKYMEVEVIFSGDVLPVIPAALLSFSITPEKQTVKQGSPASIAIAPENLFGTFAWSFHVSGDVNLALTSSDMNITGTIPALTSPGTYTVVITAHDDRAAPITSTASITVEDTSAPVTPDKPDTPEEPSEQTKPDTPTPSEPKPAPEENPSTPQMPEQDSPKTPAEDKTDESTTPQTRTNHYTFTMSAPLRNSILSAFPGLTADDIHQLSDSEIISESWNIGDSDTQELSGMRERAVLNLPAFRPQNSGVYVMMLTLTNADAGAKINLRNISGTDNVSAGSVGEMQYTFFDANGNTTDTVPDDKVIYAAVRLTAGTETRGVITVPTGTASSVMAEGTITPVEPDERESLSEIIAEEMRDVVSLEPSQIRFITEENIIAEAPDPEQSMKEQAKNDGYELVGRLNKIQVKDEGYYVFRVNLSEDLFRQLEGLSIEDIGVYAFTSGTSSVNSSFFFMLNGILNTWEILSVTGKRFHKFDKFGVREFLMIGFLNSSQPFTMYLAKAILSIMTGGLGGGCNAGLGLVSAACAVMFLIHRKER